MIKLIASDLDGTLLPEGTTDLNPEFYAIVRRLQARGIVFVAASGRQYVSMLNVLRPLANEIRFIADNGAYIVDRGREVACRSLQKDLLAEILAYVKSEPGVNLLASGTDGAYTDSRDPAFVDWIQNGYGMRAKVVDDLTKLDVPLIKVAMHGLTRDAARMADAARERFGMRATILASGAHWVDFMVADVDKGGALQAIQEQLGVSPEETMAFGDNGNDIGMLNRAAESYAVRGARPEVKRAARYTLEEEGKDAVVHFLGSL